MGKLGIGLLFIFVLCLSTESLAQIEAVSGNWKIDTGPQDPSDLNTQEIVRNLFKETVNDGIQRVGKLNPDLAKELLERLSKQNIKITIDVTGKIVEEAGTKRDGNSSEIIIAGYELQNILKVYAPDQIKPKPKKKLKEEDRLILKEHLQNMIFHEMLHVADFPMLIPHDNLETGKIPDFRKHEFERDLVYACAAQAFPSRPLYWVIDSGLKMTVNPPTPLSNTKLACQTCAGATVGKNGEIEAVDVPPETNLISNSNNTCKTWNTTFSDGEKDYVLKQLLPVFNEGTSVH